MHHVYTWMDREGRPTSPPADYPSYGSIRKVSVTVTGGQSLGLTIRGGNEYGLGIYVTGVDAASVAHDAGLQLGDQIIEVNQHSFEEISHDEAVRYLKLCKRMDMILRDVGKIPYSCAVYPPHHSPRSRRKSRCSKERLEDESDIEAVLQMIEQKARTVLNRTEHNQLVYYQSEYRNGRIDVSAFTSFLFELLNSEEKHTLLTELREVIFQDDLPHYDDMIFRLRQAWRLQHIHQNDTKMLNRTSELHSEPAPRTTTPESRLAFSDSRFLEGSEAGTPSEDSGVDVATGTYFQGHRSSRQSLSGRERELSAPPSSRLVKRTSDLALSQDEDNDRSHLQQRRHSITAADMGPDGRCLEPPNNLESSQRISSSYEFDESRSEREREFMGVDGARLQRYHSYREHMQERKKRSRVLQAGDGKYRVKVYKSKSSLGIAIEGGTDTKIPTPRIINIQAGGCAFDAGGLRVGQTILEVDGKKLEGLDHKSAAAVIAKRFKSQQTSDIEFLVRDPKPSPLDVRRSSFFAVSQS